MSGLDWTLEDNMVDNFFFCTTLTGRVSVVQSDLVYLNSEQLESPLSNAKATRNGFLPMHFTPLICKPRCLTPTLEFRNGYIKSIKKCPTRLCQLLFSCLLNHNESVKVNFLHTMDATVAELAGHS